MISKSGAIQMIGFLISEKTPGGDGLVTAMMVTDNKGYPLEFKATTPVKPSLVQRTLYGGQLEHYVNVELCGKTLVKQSSRKPSIILVPMIQLLDIADEIDINMVAIWRAGETLKVEDEKAEKPRGTIRPNISSFQPVVYEGRFRDVDSEKDVVSFLQECTEHFDLVEAFERMRAALKLLAKEDSRYA